MVADCVYGYKRMYMLQRRERKQKMRRNASFGMIVANRGRERTLLRTVVCLLQQRSLYRYDPSLQLPKVSNCLYEMVHGMMQQSLEKGVPTKHQHFFPGISGGLDIPRNRAWDDATESSWTHVSSSKVQMVRFSINCLLRCHIGVFGPVV